MKIYKQQDLRTFLWPSAHLHLAVQTLARRSGFTQNEETPPNHPVRMAIFRDRRDAALCPALLRLPATGKDEPQFLAVLKGGRRYPIFTLTTHHFCRGDIEC
ncbi:MAG: hypothetical protein D3919_01240 [Candidatus Electrothrix sp. AW5]|nr:hypothetical protein [Candidatus Electrothrix gigas]